MNENKLREIIKNTLIQSNLFESIKLNPKNGELEEERIINPKAKSYVKKRKNFIGSHIFGEDIGNLGKMYVAYSYGEHYPAYLYYNNKWYHNYDEYVKDDGEVNDATKKHKKDMQPKKGTIGMSTKQMVSLINKFKSKNGIKTINHTSVEPGEKN